jgi:hypothetical protein
MFILKQGISGDVLQTFSLLYILDLENSISHLLRRFIAYGVETVSLYSNVPRNHIGSIVVNGIY